MQTQTDPKQTSPWRVLAIGIVLGLAVGLGAGVAAANESAPACVEVD